MSLERLIRPFVSVDVSQGSVVYPQMPDPGLAVLSFGGETDIESEVIHPVEWKVVKKQKKKLKEESATGKQVRIYDPESDPDDPDRPYIDVWQYTSVTTKDEDDHNYEEKITFQDHNKGSDSGGDEDEDGGDDGGGEE